MVSESISEVAGMMENQLGWFVLKWAEVKDLPLATESSKIERFRESVTEKTYHNSSISNSSTHKFSGYEFKWSIKFS